MKTIVFRGAGALDTCFTITTHWGEEITWNVTKLQLACDAGKFGPPLYLPTADLPPADWSNWDSSDRATVDAMKTLPHVLAMPSIAIGSPTPERLALCFCDGQHRVTARQELKLPECAFYLVPWEAEREYRVTCEEVDILDVGMPWR